MAKRLCGFRLNQKSRERLVALQQETALDKTALVEKAIMLLYAAEIGAGSPLNTKPVGVIQRNSVEVGVNG